MKRLPQSVRAFLSKAGKKGAKESAKNITPAKRKAARKNLKLAWKAREKES